MTDPLPVVKNDNTYNLTSCNLGQELLVIQGLVTVRQPHVHHEDGVGVGLVIKRAAVHHLSSCDHPLGIQMLVMNTLSPDYYLLLDLVRLVHHHGNEGGLVKFMPVPVIAYDHPY